MPQQKLRIQTILVVVPNKPHDHDSNGLSEIDSLVHIVKQCDRVGFSPGTFPKINTLSNVNLSSKQVAKSSHCLFLPKIGCYFLL